MRKWMWVLAGALVLVLAASPVLAAGMGGGRLRARDGSGLDQLRLQLRDGTCAELGVTLAQFQEARQRAAIKLVDQLQGQGKLTAQQAERYASASNRATSVPAWAAGLVPGRVRPRTVAGVMVSACRWAAWP